jgi:hypothetical protein
MSKLQKALMETGPCLVRFRFDISGWDSATLSFVSPSVLNPYSLRQRCLQGDRIDDISDGIAPY